MDGMQAILYKAALEGNVTALTELLQQDRLILDRVIVNCLGETPLHVAAMLGHSEFVEKLLDRKPELSKELDSQRLSPLHLASAKGYVEIVKKLLWVNPDMCFVCDQDGRNPLHLAAIKGQVDVLKELVQARPRAAQITVHRNETILHLCVKYNQLEALTILVESLDEELVNAKDDDGFTVLHLAVAEKQIETINFLINNTRVEINAKNVCGFTALDLLARSRRHIKDWDISESLRGAGASRTSNVPSVANRTRASTFRHVPLPVHRRTDPPNPQNHLDKYTKREDWFTRKQEALMVVASLIATMAFQAGVNPPGGVWQEDSNGGSTGANTTTPHDAGTSIMCTNDKYPQIYFTIYLYSTTIGFIASLSIILLRVTGLPFKFRFFMWILTGIMWVAIGSMAVTYAVSMKLVTPSKCSAPASNSAFIGMIVWGGVMAFLLLGHTIRIIVNLARKLVNCLSPRRRERMVG